MFPKILIANRGEIACRLLFACRELGARTVAIYSDADHNALWTRLADESYALPGVSAADTYLNQAAILDIAAASGAAAIHPGYGFLSENPDFAAACAGRGIVFIGPPPAAMRALGSKANARALAAEAGVPTIPGVDGRGKSVAEMAAAAAEIGFPVLIKASAGGGGKGMRIVTEPAGFADALQAARSEAQSSFGDAHVILEKYFTEVRHVEVQILADEHGQVRHLFERECSIQRRHQKIIEESPAPNLPAAVRDEMCAAAVALAAQAGYTSAGTVEFIVDSANNFYLLEMNARLQVEHPITELVTGVDIPVWQIRIAAGERLTLRQADIGQRGHAIECRLYAEDPAQGFLPAIGDIVYYHPPAGPGIRVDGGIETGTEVSPYYDPMLAKIITWDLDRAKAIRKMRRALHDTVVLGVTTNAPFLLDILDEPDFRAGHTATNYLDHHLLNWQPAADSSNSTWLAAAALELLQGGSGGRPAAAGDGAAPDPWQTNSGWRNLR